MTSSSLIIDISDLGTRIGNYAVGSLYKLFQLCQVSIQRSPSARLMSVSRYSALCVGLFLNAHVL